MESKDMQETILPGKVPMRRWWRGPLFVGLALTTGIVAINFFAKFGGSSHVSAEAGAPSAQGAEHPCQAPKEILVREVKPLGIDRSKCQQLPNIGEATCRAGEVGMRIGRSEHGYRRVYCGGCEKLVYPTDITTTVELTVNGGSK